MVLRSYASSLTANAQPALTPNGVLMRPRSAPIRARVTFGPTCDSVDRLPGEVPLASDVQEGDFIVFQGMGAYSTVTNSRFNGFGELGVVTVLSLKV